MVLRHGPPGEYSAPSPADYPTGGFEQPPAHSVLHALNDRARHHHSLGASAVERTVGEARPAAGAYAVSPPYAAYADLPAGLHQLLPETAKRDWDDLAPAERRVVLEQVLPELPRPRPVARTLSPAQTGLSLSQIARGLGRQGSRVAAAVQQTVSARFSSAPAVAPEPEPVAPETPPRSRLSAVFEATKLKLTQLREWGHRKRESAQAWLSEPEYRTKRRVLVGVAVGAAAVSAYLLYRYTGSSPLVSADDMFPRSGGGGVATETVVSPPATAANPTAPETVAPAPTPAPNSAQLPTPELATTTPEAPRFTVAPGQRLWGVLENAGIPPAEIMQQIDAAARESGLPYEWHGQGTNRWIEVNGLSDTESLVALLRPYLKA
jgi:hypothetical protein